MLNDDVYDDFDNVKDAFKINHDRLTQQEYSVLVAGMQNIIQF